MKKLFALYLVALAIIVSACSDNQAGEQEITVQQQLLSQQDQTAASRAIAESGMKDLAKQSTAKDLTELTATYQNIVQQQKDSPYLAQIKAKGLCTLVKQYKQAPKTADAASRDSQAQLVALYAEEFASLPIGFPEESKICLEALKGTWPDTKIKTYANTYVAKSKYVLTGLKSEKQSLGAKVGRTKGEDLLLKEIDRMIAKYEQGITDLAAL